jgi:hypothetical protein
MSGQKKMQTGTLDFSWDLNHIDKPLTIIDQKTVAWIEKEEVQLESGWIGLIGRGEKKAATNLLLKNGKYRVTFKITNCLRATWVGVYFEENPMTYGVSMYGAISYGLHGAANIHGYTSYDVPSIADITNGVVEMEFILNNDSSQVSFTVNGEWSKTWLIDNNKGVIPAVTFHQMGPQVNVEVIKLE